VVKVAWALKRGKWPQKGVIWGLMPNVPRNGPISPRNGQISSFPKQHFGTVQAARSKNLEQGNLLSQTAPFIFYLQHDSPFFPVSHRGR
jgi:hypothetical protein